MKLSIITINYNNANGLRKTIQSVLSQTLTDFEYIVVDGTPTPLPGERGDDREVLESFVAEKGNTENGFTSCSWKSSTVTIPGGYYSERDSGIYNAMNKGIAVAKGEYLQFLNSGDILASRDVTERMIRSLTEQKLIAENSTLNPDLDAIPILYGNMLKTMPKRLLRDKGFAGRQPTMIDFYRGTLNHSPTYIRKTLFEQYGLYDEDLKIVSDWKWYLNVIILQNINPLYVDLDVTIFDMTGISTVNSKQDKQEREIVLQSIMPHKIIEDYQRLSFPMEQWERIQKYKVIERLFWFIERSLRKFEILVKAN